MIHKYIVKTPLAHMYAEPRLYSEITDELLYGTTLFSLNESSTDMLYCETTYGYRGFIQKKKLFSVIGNYSKDLYTVTSRFCDVLPLPEYKFKPIYTLSYGSTIEKSSPFSSVNGFTDIDVFGKRFFVKENCITKKEDLVS